MQHLWQHKLQIRPGMKTVDGRSLQVIDPGRLNTDSGPDFFNAKIKLDGETWVGNIEIHVRASDWYRHHHDTDPAYNSVILHVVGVSDRAVRLTDGRTLPQIELPCNPNYARQYATLTQASAASLPCRSTIAALPQLHIADWLGNLGCERLHMKADRTARMLASTAGDWEEVAYTTLARALGFSVNSDPFERLARAVPLRYIRKHADDLTMIEAMFLGQSGLLDQAPADNPYANRLRTEYSFLANKFDLKQPGIQWKMSRMRPANLPHRRIALLARILTSGTSLMSHILSIDSIDTAMSLFNRPLSGYWQHAYTFGSQLEASAPVALSRTSVASLVINVVAPITYAWGQSKCDYRTMDRATELLQRIPPEHNRLTAIFEDAGITTRNALESQALIQARSSYCDTGKCLYCRIGHRMLSRAASYTQQH